MFKIICKIYLFVKIRNNLYEVSSIFLNTWPQLLSPSSLMTWKRGRPFFSEWQLRRCSQWVRCDRLHSHRDYLCLPKDKINEYSSCLSVSSMVTVLPLDLWASCIGKIISQRNSKLSIWVMAPQEYSAVWTGQDKPVPVILTSPFNLLDKEKHWSVFYYILGTFSHTQMVPIIII